MRQGAEDDLDPLVTNQLLNGRDRDRVFRAAVASDDLDGVGGVTDHEAARGIDLLNCEQQAGFLGLAVEGEAAAGERLHRTDAHHARLGLCRRRRLLLLLRGSGLVGLLLLLPVRPAPRSAAGSACCSCCSSSPPHAAANTSTLAIMAISPTQPQC